MVQFEKNSFTIKIETGVDAIEAWIDTQKGLISYLQSEDKDFVTEDSRYHVLELLKEMLPEVELAKKMHNSK
jgi:hypothetical protein